VHLLVAVVRALTSSRNTPQHMHMYMYMYIYTNSNRRDAPLLAKRRFFIHTCVYLFIYIYVYVYTYTHVFICSSMYMYMYTHMYVCVHAHDCKTRLINRCFFIFGCIYSFCYVYVYPYVYVCIRRRDAPFLVKRSFLVYFRVAATHRNTY